MLLTDEKVGDLYNRSHGNTEYMRAKALARLVEYEVLASLKSAKGTNPCPHCDDTGDVHSPDGEWRGECNCGAAHYNMIDRLLRNSLDDEDYAIYSAALDVVFDSGRNA